jgi:hypothetical protein
MSALHVLTHPALTLAISVAVILGSALVLPSAIFPRRTLVAAACFLTAGIGAAAGLASWTGQAVATSNAWLNATTGWIVLYTFATFPASGGRFCRSTAALFVASSIAVGAMILGEVL